jgi:pyrophosphatase PpaX
MIFDLDGTLADTLPVCTHAFQEIFLKYTGRQYRDEEINAMFGPTEEGMIERVIPQQTQPAIADYLRAYEKYHLSCQAPFPGILETLDELRRRGVSLAVATGKGRASALISMRYLGLNGMIPILVTGSPQGAVKPALIQEILLRWGFSPDQTAYVGDTPSDMQAARLSGVIPIGAAWALSATVEKGDRDALEVFQSVDEFKRWINALT